MDWDIVVDGMAVDFTKVKEHLEGARTIAVQQGRLNIVAAETQHHMHVPITWRIMALEESLTGL